MVRAALTGLVRPRGLAAWSAVAVAAVLLQIALARDPWLRFLLWNLFLAWIPLACVAAAQRLSRTSAGAPLAVVALGLWLLFFPNAPYIVTDAVHIVREQARLPVLAAVAIALCAVVGLGCGYASLRPLHAAVVRRRGRAAGAAFVAVVLGLSSVGVYLGRVLRWNSWDAITDPVPLARSLLSPLADPAAHPRPVLFAVAFSVLLGAGYAAWVRLETVGDRAAARRRARRT